MRIQLGTIYYNKTKKYLLPCLKSYGNVFEEKIGNLFKLAIGIGDFALIDIGIKLEEHIFILIDTNLSRKSFISTLNWLKLQDYFGFEYAFDDLHLGHLHMVAIKIPADFKRTYDSFVESKYSDMYDYQSLHNLFGDRESEMKVFCKDKDFQIEFVQKVNEEFNTNIDPITWSGELEFPIKQDEEYFNKLIS